MKIPETPITTLDTDADLSAVIAKLNEVIKAINDMWSPSDGTAT